MNILMLGWELPPHNSGGLGVACYQMSKALAVHGARIDFVLPYRAKHEKTDFMKIHAATSLDPIMKNGMGAYDGRCYECALQPCGHEPLSDIRSIQRHYTSFVEQHIATNTPDVIHAHDWLTFEAGVRAKELTGRPLIVHVHATEYDRAGLHSGNPLIHDIEYNGLMMADRIIAVSAVTKQLIVERYDIPADKIEVIHNSIDISDLDTSLTEINNYVYARSLQLEGYTVVSTLGRLTLQKGLTFYLRAAARALEKYDKLLFIIAGDGDQRDELIALSAELGISDKVLFTGFVRGERWREVYAISDVFVMSSVSEPFGLTALEAASQSTAMIISKSSGVGEVLDSVLRYDYWDIDRLADQLVAIASSESLGTQLGEDVEREYLRFSWHDVAERCMQQYHAATRTVL